MKQKSIHTYFILLVLGLCIHTTLYGSRIGNSEEISKQTDNEEEINELSEDSGLELFREFQFDTEEKAEAAYEDIDFYYEGISEKSVADSVQSIIREARGMLASIQQKGNYIKNLTQKDIFELPAAIGKEIGGLRYDIIISRMELFPRYGELDAYMVFTVPQNNRELVFMGKDIKFNKKGGIIGEARLQLVTDYQINLSKGKSQIILKGSVPSFDISKDQSHNLSPTYVTMDCDGFVEMGIEADIVFSRDLLVPENETGDVLNTNLAANFSTTLSDWNDLIVQIDIPRFQVKGLSGVGFLIKEAVFDFSDIRNAPGIVYPEGYENPVLMGESQELWRGIFVKEVSVALPPEFESNNTDRTKFTAFNMLIDNMGFSGKIVAENLIKMEEGKMSKWDFSLDYFEVDIKANQLTYAGLDGELIVPVDERTRFEYQAIINPGNEYIFNIESVDSMQFDFLKTSSVEIYPGSSLEVAILNKKFRPKAILHGRMDINAGKTGVQVAGIEFQDFMIQTTAPMVDIGYFSLGMEGGSRKFAGFDMGIKNIEGLCVDNEISLRFDTELSIVGKGDGGFGGGCGIRMLSALIDEEGRQVFRYKDTSVDAISIKMDMGAIAIDGYLRWFKDDVIYGNGFRGEVDMTIINTINVEAVAVFGKVNSMNYWFADAMTSFDPGVGGALLINRIGGGAFYRMAQTEKMNSHIGESLSGLSYKPDDRTGFAFKAMVGLRTAGSEKLFNGQAYFEISFNKGGGIREIEFRGEAYFLTKPEIPVPEAFKAKLSAVAGKALDELDIKLSQPDAMMSAFLYMSYNFPEKTFHANFEVFVDVFGVVTGVGSNNRAGWAVIHVDPEEWYIHIGNPSDPCGLKVLDVVRSEGYFMAGHNIPGSPPPPAKVAEILGDIDLDYMKDLNDLGEGKGVAFGIRFEMDTGEKTFLIFYARFEAGLGFDIMLKDYGNTTCKGSKGKIGIDGWYANGQAFAYFEGDIGIKVKIFGIKKKFNILTIGAAVVLQVKAPNPFWMRGIVGGYFSVLGGMIKGRCKFEIVIGKECEIERQGSVVETVKVISELTPEEGSGNVDVFNAPQAIFNMPVGEIFELKDVDGKIKKYRVRLDRFDLNENSSVIPGSHEWNTTGDVVAFNAYEVLPPKKKIKAMVQVSFEEKVGGAWQSVKVEGKKFVEIKEVTFTTGEAPDYIPEHNVLYSYPVDRQFNFHVSQRDQGYIKLKIGQEYLFSDAEKWIQKIRFSDAGRNRFTSDISYSNYQVDFNFPEGLTEGVVYKLEIVKIPRNQSTAVDSNVKEIISTLEGDDEGLVEIKSMQAEGNLEILQEEQIYRMDFRTSMYKTAREKFEHIDQTLSWRDYLRPSVHNLGINFSSDELFDKYELFGEDKTQSLYYFEADLSENQYYNQDIYPLVYDEYPIMGKYLITNRDINKYGIPPSKAVFFIQFPINRKLESADIEAGLAAPFSGNAQIYYVLVSNYEKDHRELSAEIWGDYARRKISMTPRIERLIQPFPEVKKGYYKVKVYYRMPGQDKGSLINEFSIYNEVDP